MIKSVSILPRMSVHSLANGDGYAKSVLSFLPPNDGIRLISINGSDEDFLTDEQLDNLRKNHNFTFIHSYMFDDIGGNIWESYVKHYNVDRSSFVEFDDATAFDIVNAILPPYEPISHYNESNELLIVHCYAGISRSSAVSLALAYHLGLNSREILLRHPNIDPNKKILDKMLKALGYSEASFYSWLNGFSKMTK